VFRNLKRMIILSWIFSLFLIFPSYLAAGLTKDEHKMMRTAFMNGYVRALRLDIETIKSLLSQLKIIIKKYNHRITYHPGQFNNLASPKKQVVQNTIIDLNKHAQIMDMIGLSQTPYNKINIHIGGTYKEKDTTLKRWCENFHLLSESAQKRLTIENDDKKNCYKVEDLLYAHEQLKIPIVLDTHHHNLNNGISLEEAFNLAVNTWPTNIPPVIHMSEPRENNSRAHHDYIKNKINVFGYDVDIMFEAKQKEQAILYYKKLYS